MNKYKKRHEQFHLKTKIQQRVIKKNNFTYRIVLSIVGRYLDKSKKVLDIGCGAGTLSFYLASLGKDVIGIDISSLAIKTCRRSAKKLGINNIQFEVVEFPLKVPEGKYDLVICSEVIEHLPNDRLALEVIHKLLNREGVAIISTLSINAPLYKWGYATEFDKKVGHLRRYDLNSLVKTCEEVGFEIIETYKTEGVLRNFLFLNPIAGKFVRYIRYQLVDIVSFIDSFSKNILGESQLFLILRKPL